MGVGPARVDLYNHAYGNYELELYRQIRVETYGEDLGQTSWVTIEESREIPTLLELTQQSSALEIGCGSGKYAIRLTEQVGCRVNAVDLNPHAIRNAVVLAKTAGLDGAISFDICDASKGLPFRSNAFDAVFSNDALCHIAGRQDLLCEIFRVLKPGGRMLFSDALVIGGLLSHEEIATRSTIGHYIFSPAGENERLIQGAGFQLVAVRDTTAAAAAISIHWHWAREKRKTELMAIEGDENFCGVQRFLQCVHSLTQEKRLLRHLYLARKEAC